MTRLLFCFIFVFTVSSGFSQTNKPVSFSLFMVGHTEYFDPSNPGHLQFLQTILDYNNSKKGIIFLGNNFPSGTSARPTDPAWLDSLTRFDGPVCFIPGRSDWANGSSEGKDRIKEEYEIITATLRGKEIYLPDAACPGPVEVNVNDSLTIILIDTQWYLHPYDIRIGKCDLEEKDDLWILLQDALRRNRNREVIVAGYHPVVSYGEFGGHYPAAKEIVGFPVALYRKVLGTRSDLSHPEYKELREKMESALSNFPNVIYASSHEKNFQYIREDNIHQVIGGSLAGGGYVEENKPECESRDAGFSRLDFYQDGTVELLFFALDAPGFPLCRDTLYTYHARQTKQPDAYAAEPLPDSVIHVAGRQYQASVKKQKWMGKNYREVWSTPVRLPVFDIAAEHGGLEIMKRGGGMQTQSVRLKDSTGHQYALRSVEKFAEGILPKSFHHTFAIDLIQDNISASNPYAAMPVARLAATAGVMHTNPEIVYVPRDYRLGEYMEDLSGQAFLFEERPSDDWSGAENFGFSKNITGTDDVLDEITQSPKHQVDQQSVLKARLFDTFINDWDRHDDQWRWASFKQNGQTVYRPVPRDRDQAFYVNDGRLTWLLARKWLFPKFQGFAPLTPNMEGLVFNARYFDRTFLTQPDWSEWKLTIDTLQSALSDEKIDDAMSAFPKEVQPLVASRTGEILKQRRDNLEMMARRHYLALAENVDIVGTSEDDRFEVNRENDRQTQVSVYPLSPGDQQKQPYYHRMFQRDETKEIRLYGLDGDDCFTLDGNVDDGIKIRVIGGKGKDSISSQSRVKKPGKHTWIYDLKKNTRLQVNQDTRVKLSADPAVNTYNRKAFRYNVVTPGLYLGYNADDGLFIGGGPVFHQYRFRRQNTQSIMANFAMLTGAFNVRYLFDTESEVKGFDHHLGVELKAPDYVMNYFGMGNASVKDDAFSDSYYRLNVNQLIVDYAMGYRWGKTAFQKRADGKVDQSEFRLGVFLKHSNIEERTNRFISDLAANGLTETNLDRQFFSGVYTRYTYSNLNSETKPERGYQLEISGEQFFQLNQEEDRFFRLNADARAYISFTQRPRAVLALRAGGTKIFGDYAFLEAAKLGGKTNLRGYLADRFYGRSSFYQNSEFRYKLIDFSSYIMNGELGVLAFYDGGRVWLKRQGSGHWHQGYGSGFWLSPFEMIILTTTYNWSSEDHMLQVTLNFKF